MTGPLRALASVASANEEQRARAHGEALATETRAGATLDDAGERVREAEAALAAALVEPLVTAADRVLNEARCARLRERLRAARSLQAAAASALERARAAVAASQASLGAAHGERRVVEAAMERAAAGVRRDRARKEDDEADELGRRTSRD